MIHLKRLGMGLLYFVVCGAIVGMVALIFLHPLVLGTAVCLGVAYLTGAYLLDK